MKGDLCKVATEALNGAITLLVASVPWWRRFFLRHTAKFVREEATRGVVAVHLLKAIRSHWLDQGVPSDSHEGVFVKQIDELIPRE